jgi:hypothetical protein
MTTWTDRLRMIYISALQVDRAVLFSVVITVAAFVPLFTMQGVEGQIFGPMARTYAYALAGALIATFTVTPVLASLMLPAHLEEVETFLVRGIRRGYTPLLTWSLGHRVPAGAGGGQLLDPGGDAADDGPGCGHRGHQQDARDPATPSGDRHRGVAAWAPGQRQRRLAVFQRRAVRPAQTL